MPKPRKPSALRPAKILKIFCEGEKTEPSYINGYIANHECPERKSVVEVEKTRKNTPVQLVDVALRAKSSPQALPGDEFWVVYDRESPTKYSDELHSKAYKRAVTGGIGVALSNVCFEQWLLLHFIDSDAPYESYDDLRRNSQLNNEYRKASGNDYDKASEAMYSVFRDRVDRARKRAKRLNRAAIDTSAPGKDLPFHMNPYVGVIDLLDAIDAFG